MADSKLVDKQLTFSSFSHLLDTRILRALADLGFPRPTLVQSKTIPLALEGRDILARARTGSGKTAAYCIPVLQKILTSKASSSSSGAERGIRALILVPTRELSEQVTHQFQTLARYCEKEVTIRNVAGGTSSQLQQVLLADQPDVIVGTPARILPLLQSKTISLSRLETFVIDEADLILSYGHDEDVRSILDGSYLPKVYQSLLMSATMTEDVAALKGLVLRKPAILRLEEGEEDSTLSQYFTQCSETDKFLLTYVILKLKLIKGKCILFVNSVDRSYRLKLFLEQFSIKSCVLNSELPLNSRYHVVQEFNRGVYDYIIATDESSEVPDANGSSFGEAGPSTTVSTEDNGPQEQETKQDPREPPVVSETTDDSSDPKSKKRQREPEAPSEELSRGHQKKQKQKGKGKNRDAEYGMSRGVDFVDVACVINFDLPTSSRAYTHRTGRTARAGRTGMALSYVVPLDQVGKGDALNFSTTSSLDGVVFTQIEEEQRVRGSKVQEYKFDMKQVEAFQYRTDDALRSVTKNAVREARLKELKTELLNSSKLQAHFEDNPLDLEYLRHDKPLHPTRVQAHMKHVPNYLLPRIAQAPVNEDPARGVDGGCEWVPFRKDTRGRGLGRGGQSGGRGRRGGKKKNDPLRKFA
ncbi:ATP-dependent DNA/RNA helicase [Tulasnella sp. 330]|nr:ATP-dependent DNA/RNA helicase [Tulasnella sp. 330]KAG8883420.1 ATP-dependent DNA/RNA helicase [Tulasnella sp. 331]KAG8887465.1 ATP-dependent DNA/RNA helicase [Tulasnella sp. 332]